jgi:hypothetical protein
MDIISLPLDNHILFVFAYRDKRGIYSLFLRSIQGNSLAAGGRW